MLDLDWTLFVAMGVFLLAVLSLQVLLFKPLFNVMEERKRRTTGLQKSAQEILRQYEEKYDEYESAVREERQRGYKIAEQARKEAMEERSRKVSEARSRAEELRGQAREEIKGDVESSQQALKSQAEELSNMIASRILRKSA